VNNANTIDPKMADVNFGSEYFFFTRARASFKDSIRASFVKALNAVEQRLAAMLKEKDLPAYMYGNLKREEFKCPDSCR
jgi:hypothetical protein